MYDDHMAPVLTALLEPFHRTLYNVDSVSVSVPPYNNISSPSPQSFSFPAIAIEMSPPDMKAMFDNVQNEQYNTQRRASPVSNVSRASNSIIL